MSLDNPTTFEKATIFIKAHKIWFIIGGLSLALILGWAVLTAYQNHESRKAITDARANVNTALQKVTDAQANVANDKVNEAVAVQEFHDAVNTYTNAVNATNEQKWAVNQAIANVDKAVNANVPVGITAEDVHRMLDDIDKEQQ